MTTTDDWEGHWATFDQSVSLNPAQHYRHRLVVNIVHGLRPRRLVDIGSGQGDLLAQLSRSIPATELFGLELSRFGADRSVVKVPSADVRCVDLLAESATAEIVDIAADVALCCEVLEHLDHPLEFLRSAAVAMAPGARLVVTVPGGPRSEFDKHIGHRRHYTPGSLRRLLESAGFVVDKVDRAGFPFFNIYRLVVIARGKRLATDVADGSTSTLARLTMRAFDALFRLNLARSRWGWQNVAVATRVTAREHEPT